MCSQDIFLNPAYISEVTELETLRKLPFRDFIIQVCADIRKMSKNFDKDCAREFKEAVNNKYGMVIGAKWDDKKDTFFINFALPELSRIYSDQNQPPFYFPANTERC